MKTAIYNGQSVPVICRGGKNSRIRLPDNTTTLVPNSQLQFLLETWQEPQAPVQPASLATLSSADFDKFLDLACQLSPENLTCDGELSRSQVRSRYAQIMREWEALEKRCGIKTNEEQIWDEHMRRAPIRR